MLHSVGGAALRTAGDAGGIAITFWRTLRALARKRFERDEFFRSLLAFGQASIPIVLATAAFTGAIMVVQGAIYVRQYGVYNFVGWFTGFVTLREIGPVLVALMFSGRVGASNTSELATMRVSEQLDALRILALDVYEVLVLPRFLSMVVSLFFLVIIGDLMAVLSGAVCARLLLGLDYGLFFSSLLGKLQPGDLLIGAEKAAIFGAAIAVVSSFFGMAASGGANGVGRAVNNQVVACAVVIFVADYLVTFWHG